MARTSIGNPNVQRIIAEAQEQLGKAGYDPKMIDKLLANRSVEVNDKDIVVYLKNNYLAYSNLVGWERFYSGSSDVLGPDQHLDAFQDDGASPVKFVNMLPPEFFNNPEQASRELGFSREESRTFHQLFTPPPDQSQSTEVVYATTGKAMSSASGSKALGVSSGGTNQTPTSSRSSSVSQGYDNQAAEDLLNSLGDYEQRSRDVIADGVAEMERIRQVKKEIIEALSSASPQDIPRLNAELGDLNQSGTEIMTKIQEIKRFQDTMFSLFKSLFDIQQRSRDAIIQNIGRTG